MTASPLSLRAQRSDLVGAGRATLQLDWPVDLGLTVASHGWVHLEPWRWDADSGTLSHAERIDGRLGSIGLRQQNSTTLLVSGAGFGAKHRKAVIARAARWLSAEWDPSPAVESLATAGFAEEAALVARGGGRLLRCSTFYEDFIKTLLTVNTSWAGTCRMVSALVAEPGAGAFPTPEMLIEYGEERLRGIAKLGFRAPTAVAATRRMLDDGVMDAEGTGDAARLGYDYLIGLKGIGPYAASHCRMLLHDFSRIPVDSVVVAHLRERHATTPEAFIASRAECGVYLGLGYRLLRLREKFQVAQVELAPPAQTPDSAY